MELVEVIPKLNISVGAPLPLIIANDFMLSLIFLGDEIKAADGNNLLEPVYLLKFIKPRSHRFGAPSNETIHGHPYYPLGLFSHSFFQLKESDWLEQLKTINKIHPYYDEQRWTKAKHFIITFHDKMFECIAEGYEVSGEYTSIGEASEIVLKTI